MFVIDAVVLRVLAEQRRGSYCSICTTLRAVPPFFGLSAFLSPCAVASFLVRTFRGRVSVGGSPQFVFRRRKLSWSEPSPVPSEALGMYLSSLACFTLAEPCTFSLGVLPLSVNSSFFSLPHVLFCFVLPSMTRRWFCLGVCVFLSLARGPVRRSVWLVPSAFGYQPHRRGHPEGRRQGADRARHGHRRLSL